MFVEKKGESDCIARINKETLEVESICIFGLVIDKNGKCKKKKYKVV